MGDEQHAHTKVTLEPFDKFQNLGLNGYIEGGSRFVANEYLGAAGYGGGNNHALSHAPGKFVGILPVPFAGILDSYPLQHIGSQSF
jgi:hypothetical protein